FPFFARALATPSVRPQPFMAVRAPQPVALKVPSRRFPFPPPPNRQLPNGFRSLVGQGPSIYSHVPLYHSTMKMCSLNYRPISKSKICVYVYSSKPSPPQSRGRIEVGGFSTLPDSAKSASAVSPKLCRSLDTCARHTAGTDRSFAPCA